MPTATTAPPAAPESSHTAVIWRPCWWCGLPLLDDEQGLCAPCDAELNPMGELRVHAVADPECRFGCTRDTIDIALATQAAIDQHVELVETAAAAWATDHDLTPAEAGAYRGTARAVATEQLQHRAASDLQAIGWARVHAGRVVA